MKLNLLLNLILIIISLSSNCSKNAYPIEEHNNVSVPDTIVVAFYNVENLFDLKSDGLEYPEYTPDISNWNITIQKQKLKNIANVIAAMDAHIVALCEIENRNALSELLAELNENNYDYPYSAIADNPFKTVTCPAVISKFPVKTSRTLPVNIFDTTISRNILEADIKFDTTELKLFVNHWPSKYHPESWRFETAKILLSRIQQLQSGTDYIIIGDLNSDYDEYIKFKTMGMDNTKGRTGINHILNTLNFSKNQNPFFFMENNFETISGIFHYNLWLELPYYNRMSHFYRGNRQTPDNILLPHSLYDSTGISYCDNSFEVFTWNGKLLKNNRPFRWKFRWQNQGKIHIGTGFSDHLPIIARFKTGKFIPDTSGDQPDYIASSLMAINDSDDFELTDEGWVACNNSVEIQRDTVYPVKSKYCLSIKHDSLSSNRTVARTFLIRNKKSNNKTISFDLIGIGKISFRIREPEKKWTYYNASEFAKTKSARYKKINITEWKRINLKLEKHIGEEIEFEIRSGKNSPVHLCIDNIKY